MTNSEKKPVLESKTVPQNKDRSPLFAAAAIIIGFGLVFYAMPKIMLWLGQYSPWLAAAFGTVAVLCFFLLFWLRARYQRRRDS